MESVWWVFSQLHEKGLVYQGYKVRPPSCLCLLAGCMDGWMDEWID